MSQLVWIFLLWVYSIVSCLRKKSQTTPIPTITATQNTSVSGDKKGRENGNTVTFYVIVITSTVVFLVIVVAILFFCKRYRRRKQENKLLKNSPVKIGSPSVDLPKAPKRSILNSSDKNDDGEDDDYTNVDEYTKTKLRTVYEPLRSSVSHTENNGNSNVFTENEFYSNLSSDEYENVARNIENESMYQCPRSNPTKIDEDDDYIEFHG